MISFHTPHLYKLREEQVVETKISVMPRSGKFVNGEVLTLHVSTSELYSVTFIKYDGDRAFINKNGSVVSCFAYKLSR